MIRFRDGQRVVVKDRNSALYGKMGRVVRCRMSDDGAWVCMNADLPKPLRSFSKGDPRFRHVLLYPDECKAADV
jgi:hypothetical protein